jgi:hypothetical protein
MEHKAIQISGALLGGMLLVIFIGYAVLCLREPRATGKHNLADKLAGVFSLLAGTIILGVWAYLLQNRWGSFRAQAGVLWLHVSSEALSGLTLMVAGGALLKGLSRGPALLMLANGLLILTTVQALLSFGNRGHPMIMNGMAVIMTVTSAYMVGLVYGWGHFVLHLEGEKQESEGKRKDAA